MKTSSFRSKPTMKDFLRLIDPKFCEPPFVISEVSKDKDK